MKRLAMTTVADCDYNRFDNFIARKQLPFTVGPAPITGRAKAEDRKRRADYSVRDAFELRVMLDFTDNGGVDVEPAKYAAANSFRKLAWGPDADTDDDLYLALVQERPIEGLPAPMQLLAGTLANLPEILNEQTAPEAVRRIVLVNASEASRFVKSRAAELDVINEDESRHAWHLGEVF